MIELTDISLRLRGRPVLRGFTLAAKTKNLTLLLGANGAGKSSALKVAAGLWRPKSGGVCVDGRNLMHPRAFREHVAYLPQSPGFHPKLRTRDVLSFYAQLEGRRRDESDDALVAFGLESHAAHRTCELSGGLRQRLGLAVLSLCRAPVLLLDEPGLSLDPLWRHRLQSWLRSEAADGRTVLVATHLWAEWNGQAEVCLLCDSGRIVTSLDPNCLDTAGLYALKESSAFVEEKPTQMAATNNC